MAHEMKRHCIVLTPGSTLVLKIQATSVDYGKPPNQNK
jgi:hypothetical protein